MNKSHYTEQSTTNTVGDWKWDERTRLGHITINGQCFGLYRVCIGYRDNLVTPIYRYQVRVSNDWNMSNVFTIESAQMRGLVSKIKKHSYKLVK